MAARRRKKRSLLPALLLALFFTGAGFTIGAALGALFEAPALVVEFITGKSTVAPLPEAPDENAAEETAAPAETAPSPSQQNPGA